MMKKQALTISQKLFAGYYAATVLFLAADLLVGINVRLSFLDDLPVWRGLYYAFCAACFVMIWRLPAWANVIAAGESLVNVSGLIIEMGSRVVNVTDAVLESGRAPVTSEEIINFLISGTAAYFALLMRSRAARQDLLERDLTG